MPSTTNGFRNQYQFLSNFAPSPIKCEGIVYPTVEHAFQGAKCQHRADKYQIAAAPSPQLAKRLGRQVSMRPDWDDIKVNVMHALLQAKFQHPALKQQLLATEGVELVENNHWNDTFWGKCRGRGQNQLGQLLMLVRQEIKTAESTPQQSTMKDLTR